MEEKGLIELARKFALKNATDHGKAARGPVLNKLFAAYPELKDNLEEASKIVDIVIMEVNSMGEEMLLSEFAPFKEEFEVQEKEKEKRSAGPRMELEGADVGNFATRFPPEPNGYLQVGHAKVAWMERKFADMYRGTVALYFDDTNPEKEKQEYVDGIKRDFDWLGIRFDREYYASDHIESLYEYAEKLLKDGNAYVCKCESERMKELRFNGKECEHRSNTTESSIDLWKHMLNGNFKENEAVLRLRLDMKSKNTAMRDPVIFRIINHPHYRQKNKYIVWPTYDFNTPIIDSVEGITDVLRSKEFELRDELNAKLLDLLGLRKPQIKSVARLEIADNMTSKRKINELIQRKIISGFDDPRLVTIAGLRRRGVRPEAIKNFVLRFGMSKTDSKVSIDMLLAENRKVVDKSAKRLFCVQNPVRLAVKDMENRSAKLRLHPNQEMGYREYSLSDVFFISASDAKGLKAGDELLLKDLFGIRIINVNSDGITANFIKNANKGSKIVQWVNEGNSIGCKIKFIGPLLKDDEVNDESMVEAAGLIEAYAKRLEEGEVVNFERMGFFKLDSKPDADFISL